MSSKAVVMKLAYEGIVLGLDAFQIVNAAQILTISTRVLMQLENTGADHNMYMNRRYMDKRYI